MMGSMHGPVVVATDVFFVEAGSTFTPVKICMLKPEKIVVGRLLSF